MAPPVIIMGNIPGPARWMVPSVPMESVPRHVLHDEITDYDANVPLYPGHEFGWGMGSILYGTPIPQKKGTAGLGRPSPIEMPTWGKRRAPRGGIVMRMRPAAPKMVDYQHGVLSSGMGQVLAPASRWPYSATVAAGFAPIPAPLYGLGAVKKTPTPPTTVSAVAPAPVKQSTMYAVAGVAAAAVVASAALYIYLKGKKKK